MKGLLSVFLCCTLISFSFAQTENKKILLKVNLGGGPVNDFVGEDQLMDVEDFAKNVVRAPIANTDQQEVFQSQRFARGDDFTMRIPVPDGIYSVTLLFAETYKKACAPGSRVFDISLGTPISGVTKVIENFDVFQVAGCSSAYGQKFDRVPSKEGIVVHLTQKAQHPTLSGFIVEGFPVPKSDGSEYKAIARAQSGSHMGEMGGAGEAGEGEDVAGVHREMLRDVENMLLPAAPSVRFDISSFTPFCNNFSFPEDIPSISAECLRWEEHELDMLLMYIDLIMVGMDETLARKFYGEIRCLSRANIQPITYLNAWQVCFTYDYSELIGKLLAKYILEDISLSNPVLPPSSSRIYSTLPIASKFLYGYTSTASTTPFLFNAFHNYESFRMDDSSTLITSCCKGCADTNYFVNLGVDNCRLELRRP
ncbi:unnamed protein product [Agarophyton chilense]